MGTTVDGKKGKRQVNYGLLANSQGVPVAVSVFKGNIADPTTLLGQARRLQKTFAIRSFVIVGDRGMITQTQINALRGEDGVDWITALRPKAVQTLLADGALQMDLFDERNLFTLTHPNFAGERLVACRNPELARRRAAKRRSLLAATAKALDKVCGMVERGRLQGKDKIGVRVGRVIVKSGV